MSGVARTRPESIMHRHPDRPRRGEQLRLAPWPRATSDELGVFSTGRHPIASLRRLEAGECQIVVDLPDALPVADAEWEMTIDDGPSAGECTHVLFRARPQGEDAADNLADLAPWASIVTQLPAGSDCNRG